MATGMTHRHVRALFDVGAMGASTDGRLLERFAGRSGETAELAFATIVERHGPMVMRVCRGVLDDPNDAHDAFQATFLVLVTRLHSVRSRESLGSWLHGVALRVARTARAAEQRRRTHEGRRAAMAEAVMMARDPDEIGPVVRAEFAKLPERYHAPMTLCDLEDLTHEEAARRLGWPVGTVKSRLSRGRATLRDRLARRGLGSVPIILARPPALLPSMVDQTARTAMKVAMNGSAVGMVPASVEVLLQGVRRMMVRNMIRNGAVAVVAFGLVAAGMAIAADAPVDRQAKPASITADRQFTAKVRFLEMTGLDWKDALGVKLKPVKSNAGFKVWTTEKDVIGDLRKHMKTEVQAPRVTSFEGSTATISNAVTQIYVAAGHWEFQGAGAAFLPKFGELTDGISVTTSGRKLDQGMLVRVGIDDRRVLGFESTVIPARVNDVNVAGTIQIPQTTSLQQEGEWLIPNGGMLVLSTGSYHAEPPRVTTNLKPVDALLDELGVTGWLADRAYWSAPVVERLVVIDARSFEEPVKARAASDR